MTTLKVFADYHQFYLMDLGLSPSIPDDVSDQDIINGFRVAKGIVVFHTQEPELVDVHLSVLPEAPAPASAGASLIEVALELPSGTLAVVGCTEELASCAKVPVPPGLYRCRATSQVSEGAPQRFFISLWPEGPGGRP